VAATFNCRENKNKFCLPCGEPSARILEQTLVFDEKQKMAETMRKMLKGKENKPFKKDMVGSL
jgi:hypothetical protein